MQSSIPKDPILFQKALTSLSKSSTVIIPHGREIHHEIEIVVLIGESGENISLDNAFNYIKGIGLGLDLTDRILQAKLKSKSLPWFLSKSFKGSAVVSKFYKWDNSKWNEPFWLKKNKKIVQSGKITEMIFSIEELISYLSNRVPLLKGDLIFTGTPSGVGPIVKGDKLDIGLGNKSFMNIEVINSNEMNDEVKTFSLYVDGAADLNTKTAGVGGVFYNNDNEEVYSFSEYLDDATNNEAEYTALIKGVELGLELKLLNLNIYSDSQLIVRQINGEYQVKNDRMKKLHLKVLNLLKQYNEWTINHIMRDKNKIADKLSKEGRMLGK
jgi:ribonuclease HI